MVTWTMSAPVKAVPLPNLTVPIQGSAQRQPPEFAMSILRVMFTTTALPESPVKAALADDLVLGLLLRRQVSGRQQPSEAVAMALQEGTLGASQDSGQDAMVRQSSYTEMQLATPIPTETVSFQNFTHHCTSYAI